VFTGIIETVGTVRDLSPGADLVTLCIEAPAIEQGVRVGDSIAVNGGCLTVTEVGGGRFWFDAIRETLEKTVLGTLTVGARVNLERAMRADGRLDGHIVQGHVDGTGRVVIDGVSLTVVHVTEKGFDVALIPHTLEATNLSERRPGDRVNLEADVLGKYVRRYLDRVGAAPSG
jgi:riboflavin synthase